MKKLLTLISLVLIGSASIMFAAPAKKNTRQAKPNTKEVKGIHPYNVAENKRNTVSKEDANWSLFLHGGFNVMNGDMNADQGKEMKHSVSAPSIGLGAEYKFNPTWGMGVDYTFRRVGVTGNTSIVDAAGNPINMANLLRGFQHNASIFLTFDIFNLFFPKFPTKLFALNLIAGGDFMAYRNTNQTPVALPVRVDGVKTTINNHWKNKTGTAAYQEAYPDDSPARSMSKYDFVGGFMGGASFEFNVSRDLAVGLRALYHFYGNDKIDGRPNVGTNNDGVFDMELILRWKIEADKKSHVDNYVNKDMLFAAGRGGKRSAEFGTKDTVFVYNVDTVNIFTRDTLEIYHRDTVNIFTRDTLEIYHKDTIVMAMRGDTTNIYNSSINYITNPEADKENYFYVYFDPDRHVLSDEALVVIQQVADRMDKEPNLYAAIIGYCDNVGSAEYNKRLGQNRSQNVYDELHLEYGLDEDRMFAISRGIVVGKRSSAQYAPNRRVEIRLVERSFFNQLRAQYREDIESQKAFVKTRKK